jgi:hypothetical protein
MAAKCVLATFTPRSEITLKFSGSLPTATPAPSKKVEIELTDQNGIVFTALVNAKSWRKAEANAAEFESWAGAVSGKLGQRTDKGFEVVDAGIQIFEKKKPVEPKPETSTRAADALPIL